MVKKVFISLFFFNFLMHGQTLVLDPDFGTNGVKSTTDGITPINGYFEDNRYYFFGNDTRFARYNYDGSKDTAFGNYGFYVFNIPGEYPILKNFKVHDGKCYGFGKSESATTSFDGIVVRLTTDGQPDIAFGTNGVVRFNLGEKESFNDILINNDGSFYALGTKQTSDLDSRVLVCKFLENGSLDTTFNTTGYKVFPFTQAAKGISIFQYGNGILLGNWTKGTNTNISDIYLQKINSSGVLMSDFGTAGELRIPLHVNASASPINFIGLKLSGNKIYCHFYWGTSFNSQGYRLSAFDITNPTATPIDFSGYFNFDSYFQPLDSGKLMVARGISCLVPGCYSTHFTLRQYNSNGILDTTFDNDGIYEYDFTNYANGVEGASFFYAHNDSRILIAGALSISPDGLHMLRIGSSEVLDTNNPIINNPFSIYPNPSSQIIYINNENGCKLNNAFISDIVGKKIQVSINENNLDISSLSKGIYFLSFSCDSKSYTFTFVKS